jgi:uncharacterized protein (DUF1778 family)
MAATVAKDRRINVRATGRQEALLRRAARAVDRTLTDFVVDAAVAEAERVLADHTAIFATEKEFEDFQRLIDAPVPNAHQIRAFLTRPSAL